MSAKTTPKSIAKAPAKPAAPAKSAVSAKPAVVQADLPADVSADNRIAKRFAELQAAGKKAFIAYLCAGDPTIDATVELVVEMAEQADPARRVDIVELGIPYSDPMADGPANQAACERALSSGASVKVVLDAVRRIRLRSQVPLLFFTYLNPVLRYGTEKFAKDALAAGADGVLLLDLPPEVDPGVFATFRKVGLATVCLAAPTTTTQRRSFLASESRGFLYYVCRLGVTGERAELPKDLAAQVKALKAACPAPVCVGFGISTPEHAAAAAKVSDGAIVGSHLVRLIERHGKARDLAKVVAQRAGEMAAAVHSL
jgi:tryptophan synthase alpha chain